MKPITARRLERQRISVESFIKLSESQRRDIKSVRIVPASLDQKGDFGALLVEWKHPVYWVESP